MMGGGWRGHGSIPGRTRRPPLRKRSCYDSIFIQLGDEILQLGVDRMRLCGYFVVVLIGVLVSMPVTAQRSKARKPEGANFYPVDMTKQQFGSWLASLTPEQQAAAKGFFTVIRWNSGNGSSAQRELTAIPYNQEYKDDLTRAAGLLKEAADLTENASLKKFLSSRADAFLSNDYYDSDIAWMDLDAPLDVTIGPYEVYNDELFNYKAAFEAFINLRDDAETKKFSVLANHLQEIEDNLPIDPHYRNPKLGAAAPTVVVDEIFSSGDGDHGVATAAYNQIGRAHV